MSKILHFALSFLLASSSILSVAVFPVAFAYSVKYDSRWQMFSASMLPTLEVLDWVFVKNVSGQAEVYASYVDGDIILFRKPGNPDEFIIHRAVDKGQYQGTWYFTTKGDNNLFVDNWIVPEDDVVGKVVAIECASVNCSNP